MARQGETGCDADLFIYAWQDGEARMVARHIGLDTFAGDQAVICLYLAEGHDGLYGALAGPMSGYFHWYSEDGVELREENMTQIFIDKLTFYFDDVEVSFDEYRKKSDSFPRNERELLIYSVYDDPYSDYHMDGRDMLQNRIMESEAMTFGQAIEYLESYDPGPDQADGGEAAPEAAMAGEPNAPAPLRPEYREELAPLYTQYAGLLEQHRNQIDMYPMIRGFSGEADEGAALPEPRSVAFVDIMGDDAPELVFVSGEGDETGPFHVNVFSDISGTVSQVGDFDLLPDSGSSYEGVNMAFCMYQLPDNRDLHVIFTGDERAYIHLYSKDDLTLLRESVAEIRHGPDRVYSFTLTEDNKERQIDLTGDDFEAIYGSMLQQAGNLVMFSYQVDADGELVLDGRDAIGGREMPCMGMTCDEAAAFLAGEPDVSALSGAAQADPEPEGMGLPEAVYERVMIAGLTPDEYMLMVFHADGSFEQTWSIAAARSDQDVYDSSFGTIDSVRQIGEGVYELHVADTGRGDGGYDGYSSTQAGETLTLVLPGAGPDALHGSIIETYDENYEEIPPVYNSEYFYIGQKNPDGSILYTPYYSQKYVDKYMKD